MPNNGVKSQSTVNMADFGLDSGHGMRSLYCSLNIMHMLIHYFYLFCIQVGVIFYSGFCHTDLMLAVVVLICLLILDFMGRNQPCSVKLQHGAVSW